MALWQLDAWLIAVITSLPLMLRCLKWLCFVAGKAVCQQDSLLKPQLSRAAVAVPAGFHLRWVVVHQDWCAYAGFQGTGTVESETVTVEAPYDDISDVPSCSSKRITKTYQKLLIRCPLGIFWLKINHGLLIWRGSRKHLRTNNRSFFGLVWHSLRHCFPSQAVIRSFVECIT